MIKVPIAAICAGAAAPMAGGKLSGIANHPLAGPVAIGERGIAGDQQVDRVHHGWPAMALHQFPHDHYSWLRDLVGDIPQLAARGGMGENLSTDGVTEADVLIGDRFRLGTALIELTQPRQPCVTIERHVQRKGVVAAMVEAGLCGWFFRVLEPGEAQAGDSLEPVEAGHAGWTVQRTFRLVYGGGPPEPKALAELTRLPRVSDRLQRDIARRFGIS